MPRRSAWARINSQGLGGSASPAIVGLCQPMAGACQRPGLRLFAPVREPLAEFLSLTACRFIYYVAALKDSESLMHQAELVELRVRRSQWVEPGGGHEVGYRDTADRIARGLNWVAHFEAVGRPLAVVGPQVAVRVDEHLKHLMREHRGNAPVAVHGRPAVVKFRLGRHHTP